MFSPKWLDGIRNEEVPDKIREKDNIDEQIEEENGGMLRHGGVFRDVLKI